MASSAIFTLMIHQPLWPCTFLFSSVLHFQFFLLFLQVVSGTQPLLHPAHIPGTNEGNSLAVTQSPLSYSDLGSSVGLVDLAPPGHCPGLTKQTGYELSRVPLGDAQNQTGYPGGALRVLGETQEPKSLKHVIYRCCITELYT